MGREIRRVPPPDVWQHPKYEAHEVRYGWQRDAYKPLHQGWQEDMEKWLEGRALWLAGKHEACTESTYEESEGQMPDPNDYTPDWPVGTCTWWAVYETVSEGTPVTPAFATPEELIDYLCTHGDTWDQHRGSKPWSRASAEAFVREEGWAPSMVVTGRRVMTGVEALGEVPRE